MPGKRWSSTEQDFLRRQFTAGVPLDTLTVPNRTEHAITSQLRRLGLLRSRRSLRRWDHEEIELLKSFTAQGYSARRIVDKDYFPYRSIDSVAQQMRRRRLGNPILSRRQRKATRLKGTALARFHRYLRTHARHTSTNVIAKRYHVSRGTVKRHLRQLGIVVTWRDAMAMPPTRTRLQRLARARNLRRWAQWRDLQERRLKVLVRKLREMHIDVERRTCNSCGRTWYATEEFFKLRPKRRNGRVVAVYLSRACRICLSRRRTSGPSRPSRPGYALSKVS